MKPLWKIRSGKFAGWRVNDALYDDSGKNVGYFIDDIAYSTRGSYIGEIYGEDWIGKRTGIARGNHGSRGRYGNIGVGRYANRGGIALGGWKDPDY